MISSYYRTLNLPAGGDLATVKAAYRKLAMQHHPDRGGDPGKFREVTAAYNHLEAHLSRPRPRSTISTSITVTLEQVAAHRPTTVVVARGGRPYYVEVVLDPLWESGESFTVDDKKHLDIQIKIAYNVAKHRVFTKVGLDLYCTVAVPVWDFIAGGAVVVHGLQGEEYTIAVPAGATEKTTLKLPGRGLIALNGTNGSLFVNLSPVLPKTMSPELKAAIIAEQHLLKGTSNAS